MRELQVCILANLQGPEASYSIESAEDAGSVIRAETIYLTENDWRLQIQEFGKPHALYLLATHGGFGEDGRLHSFLEERGLRHTHSVASSCEIMANKHRTKMLYVALAIPTPHWKYKGVAYPSADCEVDGCEWISKPLLGGGKTDLRIERAPGSDEFRIYERFVPGKLEVSVCVVNQGGVVALPPVVRSRSRASLGLIQESSIIPELTTLDVCVSAARSVHSALSARGVTKTDFVIDDLGRPFAIETDAHPALGRSRATAMAASRSGMSYSALMEAILDDCQ